MSTMHRPYGLMQKILSEAAGAGQEVFKWCVWEVIETCPPDRNCSRCPLNEDCQGKARLADGYMKIDDCIAQMQRSSRTGWESEMLWASAISFSMVSPFFARALKSSSTQ